MRSYYKLTLREPVIISRTSAQGGHQVSDYIPGSAILGVAASSVYSKLDKQTSWDLFHSGKCIFSSVFPADGGEIAFPTPSSLHFAKGVNPIHNSEYQISELTNHANIDFKRDAKIQYKQCREGYITSTGHSVSVKKGYKTKTAIDNRTGSVKEGRLFSYGYLEAGQEFIGWIECEDTQHLQIVKDALTGEKRIGRSRSAEFGRVDIQDLNVEEKPPAIEVSKQLVLWCISNCQCLGQNGLPTYTPDLPDLIASAEGRLNRKLSFIRSTRTSLYNQTRKGLDSEQLQIAGGSVLVFDDVDISSEDLAHLQQKGIGINRHIGLGSVVINPNWSRFAELPADKLFSPVGFENVKQPQFIAEANSPMTQWIQAAIRQSHEKRQARTQVERLMIQILNAYQNARHYNRVSPNHNSGPSRSQWRRIMDLLRYQSSETKTRLFDSEDAICKPENDAIGWGVQWHNGTALITFSEFLKQTISTTDDDTLLSLCEQLCRYDLSNNAGLELAHHKLTLKSHKNAEA